MSEYTFANPAPEFTERMTPQWREAVERAYWRCHLWQRAAAGRSYSIEAYGDTDVVTLRDGAKEVSVHGFFIGDEVARAFRELEKQ